MIISLVSLALVLVWHNHGLRRPRVGRQVGAAHADDGLRSLIILHMLLYKL